MQDFDGVLDIVLYSARLDKFTTLLIEDPSALMYHLEYAIYLFG